MRMIIDTKKSILGLVRDNKVAHAISDFVAPLVAEALVYIM